eukprot:2289912-Ditylum_brightwellii.AAC.1
MLIGHAKGECFLLAGDFNEPLTSTSGMIKLYSDKCLKMLDMLGDLTDEYFSTSRNWQRTN